ncbi:MAG: hypothetical protein IKV14_00815 [Muribaculaceae bacterium]|nr:hypothetical protein [Muribaculaceae bacterium]
MSKGNLEKDPNKLYWDEENQVYMQYSPISDMFLVRRISPFDIDKEEYNPNNLPRYSGESANKSSDTFDKQETDKNNNQYVLCSSSTDSTSMLFPGYDNVLKNNILTEKENMNNSQGPVIQKYEPLDKRIPKQYSTGLNPNQSNKVPQNILGNKGYGIMKNDYSENVDTLALTKQYPELGRITQFSASKSIPKNMWGDLGDGVNYLTNNGYGERVLNTIPNKGLHFGFNKSVQVPAQAKWPEKSIIFSQTNPDFSTQAEELFHQGQYNFYNKDGRKSKDIPAMNLEMEAKTGVDIIKYKGLKNEIMEDDEPLIYNKSVDPNIFEGYEDALIVFAPKTGERSQQILINENFNGSIGDKMFMGRDLKDKYIEDLYKRYLSMIKQVSETGIITPQDLDLYNEIGIFLPQEKSNHDSRVFNNSIPPEYLLHILKK